MVNVRPAERIELSPLEALIAVLQGQADAMFYVAGKPVKLFTTLGELQAASLPEGAVARLARRLHPRHPPGSYIQSQDPSDRSRPPVTAMARPCVLTTPLKSWTQKTNLNASLGLLDCAHILDLLHR
jgi:hypothetical protein